MRIGKNFPSINTAEEIGKQYGVTGRTIKNDEQFSRAVDKVASEVGDDAKQAIRISPDPPPSPHYFQY